MTPHPEILTAVGWCTAALLGGLHFRTRQRLVLVARASHELRGPLCAARLGLGTLGSEPGRIAAIDLELARAGRALDDLAAAPSGARVPEHRRPIDLAELVRSYAPAWITLAAAHGAELRLEGEAAPGTGVNAVAPAGLDALAGAVEAAARKPAARHLRAVADDVPRTWRDDGPPAPPAPAPPPPTTFVTADPLRIAQAVANLVSNAAEHGGGVVRVRVRGSGERVRIEVADDGPGLPAPVGTLARAHTGRRGHGLAIAAGIAEHHGGRLAALPAPAGARVVLDLPAAP
jgi:signal transduction histidine kinase